MRGWDAGGRSEDARGDEKGGETVDVGALDVWERMRERVGWSEMGRERMEIERDEPEAGLSVELRTRTNENEKRNEGRRVRFSLASLAFLLPRPVPLPFSPNPNPKQKSPHSPPTIQTFLYPPSPPAFATRPNPIPFLCESSITFTKSYVVL